MGSGEGGASTWGGVTCSLSTGQAGPLVWQVSWPCFHALLYSAGRCVGVDMPQDGASFFCATPLAASLCGGTGAAGQSDAAGGAGSKGGGGGGSGGGASALESSGYIIVETNFRVGGRLAATCTHTLRS